MFDVTYSNQSASFIKKSPKEVGNRVLKKIEELRAAPVMHDTKVIHGYKEKLFRVRVGDYRILYEVDYAHSMIGIVKIDKRDKVYD